MTRQPSAAVVGFGAVGLAGAAALLCLISLPSHSSSSRVELLGGWTYTNPMATMPGQPISPMVPMVAPGPTNIHTDVVANTAVVVPVCDTMGCYQVTACADRWDYTTQWGGCTQYGDWTQRMGYCQDDQDAMGLVAAEACPVACDTCTLGWCYNAMENKVESCGPGYSP